VANDEVSKLLRISTVVAPGNAELLQAFALDFADFEDAVQAACAIR